MMLHFYVNKNTKYCLEALRLQCDLACLPPYLVHQLTWGRFINTHGGPGNNIPSDLHNEHTNRHYKDIISYMGANFTEQASTRAARSLSTVVYTVELFDKMTGIHKQSTGHTAKSDVDDVLSIVRDVQSYQILTAINERDHKSFPAFSPNLLHGLKHTKLDEWIRQKVKQHNVLQTMDEDFSEAEENTVS